MERAALLLLSLLGVALNTCSCSVIMQTGNLTLDAMADMPADFGPRVPPEGISGLLVVAEPEDACTPQVLPPVGSPWIALVMRSQAVNNCTFDLKVRNVEAAGASAAIVYDDVIEPLIIMSRPPDRPDPGIPAVFVSQRSGVMLKRLITPGVTTVVITPLSDAIWLSMLMSAFAGFLAMSVVMGTFFFIRHQRMGLGPGGGGAGGAGGGVLGRAAQRTMTPEQIRALPVVIYEDHPHGMGSGARAAGAGAGAGAVAEPGAAEEAQALMQPGAEEAAGLPAGGAPAPAPGEVSDEESAHPGRKGGGTLTTCAICLDNYVEGDKLRVLPCQHRYHMQCIDLWLSSRRAQCPACRHDATERDVEAGEGAGAGGPANAAQQSTAGRVWSFLGGRWLQWRVRNPPAARLARRIMLNELEEQQQLIQPSSAASQQQHHERQQQQERQELLGAEAAGHPASPRTPPALGAAAAAAANSGSGPAPRFAVDVLAGGSYGSAGTRAPQEEITPAGGPGELAPDPRARQSPRALCWQGAAPSCSASSAGALAATPAGRSAGANSMAASPFPGSAGSSAGGGTPPGRQQGAGSGDWLMEARADSSTDGSEAS